MSKSQTIVNYGTLKWKWAEKRSKRSTTEGEIMEMTGRRRVKWVWWGVDVRMKCNLNEGCVFHCVCLPLMPNTFTSMIPAYCSLVEALYAL